MELLELEGTMKGHLAEHTNDLIVYTWQYYEVSHNHRTSELEGTHKHHQVQLLAPHEYLQIKAYQSKKLYVYMTGTKVKARFFTGAREWFWIVPVKDTYL